jgi:hypothetical protein
MRSAKTWLLGSILGAVLLGACMFMTSTPSTAQPPPGDAQWRYHDGHWSYYYPADKRWYYTDGSHWYANEGTAWKLYNFDRGFGKEHFERGEYKAPAEVIVPRHEVYRPR